MGQFGGFFKGEKKKKKRKGPEGEGSGGHAPTFVQPSVINKGKYKE
jgi:hypothetical protein